MMRDAMCMIPLLVAVPLACERGETETGTAQATDDSAAVTGEASRDDAAITTTETSSASVTSEDTADETSGPTASCDCFEWSEPDCTEELLDASIPGCAAVRSCAPIHGACPGEYPDNCDALGPACLFDLEYSGGIDCVLQALVDGVSAVVTIEDDGWGGFRCSHVGPNRRRWWIGADGMVVVARCTKSDAGVLGERGARYETSEVEYFAACLDLEDDTEKFTCLREGLSMIEELGGCR
jgi:hypothetical protein